MLSSLLLHLSIELYVMTHSLREYVSHCSDIVLRVNLIFIYPNPPYFAFVFTFYLVQFSLTIYF